MAEVILKEVFKKWGDVTGVDNFNLTIADGEFLVLVGPSGCGKSTTLRILAGLEDPSSGEIWIDGREVTDLEPKDRDIAMVFQSYALYPHKNVFENMSFALMLRGEPKDQIRRAVCDVAELLGITPLLERKPKELSGGQRQRVALGRAIVRKPSVFLMDEPLSNLDAKLRVVMRSELIRLHQRLASTFVYVTHDQTEAMTMGTRIVVMKDGLVQQTGTPSDIYDAPCNRFVAGFIGSPPMNFIDGTLNRDHDGFVFSSPLFDRALHTVSALAAARAGKAMVLGVRPEHLNCVLTNESDDACLHCEVVEHVGASYIIHASHPVQGEVVMLLSSRKAPPRPGQSLKVMCDEDCVHLFDAETDLALHSIRDCTASAD